MPVKSMRFTEGTLLPVSLVILIMSAVYWVASLSFQVTANAEGMHQLTNEQKMYSDAITQIKLDIAEIKGMVKNRESK